MQFKNAAVKLDVETNKSTNCKVQICTNGNKSVFFAKNETGSGNLKAEIEFNE